MSDYERFVQHKLSTVPPTGIADGFSLPGSMFPHQSALTAWALRRGRAAIFADTGLGKMRMELAWADAVRKHTQRPVMIHTPLAVAAQIAIEAAKIGIDAKVCREPADLIDGINITNYDRRHKFDASIFGGVVLDESGCIKHSDTRTFLDLTAAYRDTPFKLPATATPAPNDWTELGTHAEFLGICTKQEMLAEFFTHDGGDTSVWRLKGHARAIFWRWVATWGAMIRKPSDLGFDDGAYNLPGLHVHEHHVNYEMPLNGMLFATEAQTLSERRQARKESMADRVASCVSLIFGEWASELEARVSSGPDGARSGEPGTSGKAIAVGQRQPGPQQGCSQRVHGDLLQEQPAEVPEAITGSASCAQREALSEVRRELGMAGGSQSIGESMAGGQPDQAQSPTAEAVQPDAGTVRRDAGGSVGDVRDLQDGAGRGQVVPGGGPLPQHWASSRLALHGLQSGAGEVQRQPGTTASGHSLSRSQWIVWCDLNAEQDALEKAFGELAFSVRGADTADEKEDRLYRWLAGERPVIISKPSILGWGINMQCAARMAFVGVTDSYEAYYQAVRRCWRFGQTRDVHVHVFASKAEGNVVANLRRKEREAGQMADDLSVETRDAVMAEVVGLTRATNTHNASRPVAVPAFLKEAA